MFISKNKVRMHDTDMAGILYYANQFRFVSDAWEDLLIKEGLSPKEMFSNSPVVIVIVHAEADYKVPLVAGDEIAIQVSTKTIGTSSVSMQYEIRNQNDVLCGTAETVHVCVEATTRQSCEWPASLKSKLKRYLRLSKSSTS